MRQPYEEMRILSYGLSAEEKQRIREQVPVIFSPSYDRFDFSLHDGWDRLRDYRALSVICNPVPKKRLTPYAPPYVVLRGVEELRRIMCPPAHGLIVLSSDPDPRFSAFPHLTMSPGLGSDPALQKAAAVYEQAQTPCLKRLDSLLPQKDTDGPTFSGGYIVLNAGISKENPDILRICAQPTKNFAPDGQSVEFLLKTGPADDMERSARASDAFKRFAQWNADGLPLVTQNADLLISTLRPLVKDGDLPSDGLLVDLIALWARLFPEEYCDSAQKECSLAEDVETAKRFFAPLGQRYFQPFDHFLQLLDLYRPQALDKLAKAQTSDNVEDERKTA